MTSQRHSTYGPERAALESSVLAAVRIAHVIPEDAVAKATVTYQEHGRHEDEAADGAGLALQEEADHVEQHEHDVGVEQRGVQRLGDQQDGDEPLKAVHFVWLGSRSRRSFCLGNGKGGDRRSHPSSTRLSEARTLTQYSSLSLSSLNTCEIRK